jgi:hypothetical protein
MTQTNKTNFDAVNMKGGATDMFRDSRLSVIHH